jgi:hypothetical protein
MSKKDFIALADVIKAYNNEPKFRLGFCPSQLDALADFCQAQNPAFKRDRWLAYIAGECGPNGGAVKKSAA